MATFIPQVQGAVAKVEAFQPDWGFMQGWLETKQGQYNSGLAQLNSVYSTLKQLPLTLDENVKKRDDFFLNADSQIKRLAGTDLSLNQNIMAAKNVFNPLATDEGLLEDFNITSQAYAVMRTANNFLKSSDESVRARYNPISSQFAGLKLEEYKMSSPERRAQIASQGVRYVDNVNVLERATEIADKLKLKFTAPLGMSNDGAYDITGTNGDLILGALDASFRSILENDPLVGDYVRQKGYVAVQSELQSRAKEIGYDAAQQEAIAKYVNNPVFMQGMQADLQDNSRALNGLHAEKEQAEKQIESEGVVPGSDAHKRYLDILKNIDVLEGTNTNLQNTIEQVQAGTYNPKLENAYYNVGITSLRSDIRNSAQTLSLRDAEIKRTPNEYYKMRKQHQYRVAELDYQHDLKKKYYTWEKGQEGANANLNPFLLNGVADPNNTSFLATEGPDGEALSSFEAQKTNLADLNAQGIEKRDAYVEALIQLDPAKMEAVGITADGWSQADEATRVELAKKADAVNLQIAEAANNGKSYNTTQLIAVANLQAAYTSHSSLVRQADAQLDADYVKIVKNYMSNDVIADSDMTKELYTLLLKPDGTPRTEEEFKAEAMKSKYAVDEIRNPGFTDYLWAAIPGTNANKLFSAIPFTVNNLPKKIAAGITGAYISQQGDVQDAIDDKWEDFQREINKSYTKLPNRVDVRAPFLGGNSSQVAGGAGGINIPSVVADYYSDKGVNPNGLAFTKLYSAALAAGYQNNVYNGPLEENGQTPKGKPSTDAEAALKVLNQALVSNVGKNNEQSPRPSIRVTQFAGENKDQTAVQITFDANWIGKNRKLGTTQTEGRPIDQRVNNTITLMVPSDKFYAPSIMGSSQMATEWNHIKSNSLPVNVPGVANGSWTYSNGALMFNGSYSVFDPSTGKNRTVSDPLVVGNSASPADYVAYMNARATVWSYIQEVAKANASNKEAYNRQNGITDPAKLRE